MTNADHLIEQFVSAKNIKNPDTTSKEFLKDFLSYLEDMKSKAIDYTFYLNYLGFDFADSSCAEFGKGFDDSVVLSYDTNIITTDLKHKFNDVDYKRILNGKLVIYNETPYLYHDRGLIKLPFYIRNYMTQNPYSKKELNGLSDLHNSENASIIAGVYGDITDSDKKRKIKMIKSLKYQLYDRHYIEEYYEDKNTYLYVVGSNKQVVKVRQRLKMPSRSYANNSVYAVKKR